MAFAVTATKWIDTEVDRIAKIITSPKYWHRTWTDNSLRQALDEIGLHYSAADIKVLNDELHNKGVVTDVGGPPNDDLQPV